MYFRTISRACPPDSFNDQARGVVGIGCDQTWPAAVFFPVIPDEIPAFLRIPVRRGDIKTSFKFIQFGFGQLVLFRTDKDPNTGRFIFDFRNRAYRPDATFGLQNKAIQSAFDCVILLGRLPGSDEYAS